MYRKLHFKEIISNNHKLGYDKYEDYYTLIVPSFLECYGINLLENDIDDNQFNVLLGGLRKGILIEYIRIRTENDPQRIAEFGESEMKIYEEWQQKLMEDWERENTTNKRKKRN